FTPVGGGVPKAESGDTEPPLAQMPAAPFLQHTKRPPAGPGCLAVQKIIPHHTDACRMQMSRESGREARETLFDAWPESAAQPFFPRQCEGAFLLLQDALRKEVLHGGDEQRFVAAGLHARFVRKGAHEFDEG